MVRQIYKVQLRLEQYVDANEGDGIEGEEDAIWRDFYMDMNQIHSWYLPDLHKKLGKAIIVFTNGDSFYLKQEKHVLDFLTNNVFPI